MSLPPLRPTSSTRRLATLLAVPALVVALAPAAALAAAAPDRPGAGDRQPHLCNDGDTVYRVSKPIVTQVVTHASVHENYTGSPAKRTQKTYKQTILQARVFGSADLEAGGSAKIYKIFEAGAKAKFHVEVAASGKRTTSSTQNVTYTMKSGDRYVFYVGESSYAATWRSYDCAPDQESYVLRDSGAVRSYAVHTDGGVGCDHQSPPARSMALVAQRKYC